MMPPQSVLGRAQANRTNFGEWWQTVSTIGLSAWTTDVWIAQTCSMSRIASSSLRLSFGSWLRHRNGVKRDWFA
jgi:hypothetical protein